MASSRVLRRDSVRRGQGRGAAFSLVFAIYLVAATIIAGTTVHIFHANSVALAPAVTAPPKYLVLMVLDGARPDYLNLTSLPHTDALRAAGTQFTQGIDGILEAETPAGHATISAGSRPDKNGILGFDWVTDNTRYSLFSPDQMSALEQILSNAHASTLVGLYKHKYPKAVAVALSGHKYYAAAPLGGPSADAIMYYQGDPQGRYVPVAVPGHVPPAGVLTAPGLIYPTVVHLAAGVEDNLATSLALSSVNVMHPRMLLINYPEFDWPLGHVYGGILDKSRVIADMRGFDKDLGRIEDAYRKAGILNQTLFVITADHGMMPITHFVPATVVTNAVTQAGTTSPDIASSSGDYVWLADPTKAQAVAQNVLNAKDPGVQSAYYLATVNGAQKYVSADTSSVTPAMENANQYLLSALMNGHEPQVVVFGNEGASFSDPTSNWKADHGGNSWQSQHMPLIFSGPGIQSGVVSNTPVQLDDIAPTVLTDMGVTPTGMDGTPLTQALTQSTPAQLKARAAEQQYLGPVANALSSADQAAPAK
ncbi:MAG: alkaline phosphatase family protein [Chloroflexota bacterium]